MEPVKPVNSKTQKVAAAKEAASVSKNKKTIIGGVEFNKDQIDYDKTTTYTQDGKKINSVFVKPGVRIDYPDQKDSGKKPSVKSIGLRNEWYNPDDSNIHITDLDNAKIYGNPNKSDNISLLGKSEGNEILVDRKESWYVNGDMRKDTVYLGPETSNNTVHMDEKDKTEIGYNQTGIEMNGEEVQSSYGQLNVEGKGTSEQEVQLKESLKDNYKLHKHLQND